MNLKDEMMDTINKIIAPALDILYEAGPMAYICSTIFIAVGLITVFAFIILYPFMKFIGWTGGKR